MKRALRNRLVDLFLGAFDNRAKRDEMLWLRLFCEESAPGDSVDRSVADLMEVWARRYPTAAVSPATLRDLLGSLGGLFTIVRTDGRRDQHTAVSPITNAANLRVRLHPDLCACLPEACDRMRTYLRVLDQVDAHQPGLDAAGPLHRALAQAALCFNAGLFFETHEHLEHHWYPLERSPTRRFLQGIIQISVGFHHAMRGSYEGAVNQLAKGLAKLGDAPADALGLDRDRFAREVFAAREALVGRGRARMRPAALEDLPRMHLRP